MNRQLQSKNVFWSVVKTPIRGEHVFPPWQQIVMETDMPERREVENAVLPIIALHAKVEPGTLTPETELSTLELDSLDFVEIVFAIEEALDISLPFNINEAAAVEGGRFKTARDVIDLVMEHVGQDAKAPKA
jgi:acyl carrier protein